MTGNMCAAQWSVHSGDSASRLLSAAGMTNVRNQTTTYGAGRKIVTRESTPIQKVNNK